jgi:hypothetical protein
VRALVDLHRLEEDAQIAVERDEVRLQGLGVERGLEELEREREVQDADVALAERLRRRAGVRGRGGRGGRQAAQQRAAADGGTGAQGALADEVQAGVALDRVSVLTDRAVDVDLVQVQLVHGPPRDIPQRRRAPGLGEGGSVGRAIPVQWLARRRSGAVAAPNARGYAWPLVDWTFFYLMVLLKLPIVGLFWIVWWAVKAGPEADADDADPTDGEGGSKKPREPFGPRPRTVARTATRGSPRPRAPARARPAGRRLSGRPRSGQR